MKKFFYVLAFVGVVLTGCKDSSNSPENGNGAFTFTEDVSKPLEFDGGSAKRALNFTAQADWSVSIQQGTSKVQAKKSPQKAAENSVTWITVSPMSGQKGTQQITITCAPNDQNEERSATITISDGKNELKITIVQEALTGDFDVFSAMDDKNFIKYCRIKFDANEDGKLSLTEAQAVKEINPNNDDYYAVSYWEKIRSFQGIEYFTNLRTLNIGGSSAVSLDVSKNTTLKWLECNSNQLTSLDVSGCTALTSLDCNDNQLTSLDVSKNTTLKWLECNSNQLTELDVSKNTALRHLKCNSNQLTELDVSKNTALTSLYCSSNQLTSLDVSNNTELTRLDCSSNQLTSLDVSQNTALEWLECYSNQLTSLDVSNNTALTSLYCSFNQLTSLDVSKNTALTWLSCNDNQLTSLDVSNTAMFLPSEEMWVCLFLLPMSTLKTLYLKTGASYEFYEYITGYFVDGRKYWSIDDIKSKGIEVIYK